MVIKFIQGSCSFLPDVNAGSSDIHVHDFQRDIVKTRSKDWGRGGDD